MIDIVSVPTIMLLMPTDVSLADFLTVSCRRPAIDADITMKWPSSRYPQKLSCASTYLINMTQRAINGVLPITKNWSSAENIGSK